MRNTARSRMRKACRKFLKPQQPVYRRWGNAEDIREWYYWHRREVQDMRSQGAYDPGVLKGESLL